MKKKYFLLVCLVIALSLFSYWDVLINPQIYYDDSGSIFALPIASKSFNWAAIRDVLSYSYGGFRPVSYFSFYLNFLFGGDINNLYPYIWTNFCIHIINALIVFLFVFKISRDFYLSLLVCLAWALSPVNAFAVVYLVQRMTQLMFLFGMLSFLFFIKFLEKRKFIYLLASVFLLLFSFLSKESGVLFIPAFFVYAVWFGFFKLDIKKLYISFILLFTLFVLITSFFFLPESIIRGFSPYQRLLTEFRVILFYMKALVVPFSSDIFLYLDFPISKTLFNPLSTFFSAVFLFCIFIASYYFYHRDKVVSFGILGFFIFHILESTTIPLYIAFLHRNYVASLFLYIAVFSLLKNLIKKEIIFVLVYCLLFFNFLFVLKKHNAMWISPFFYEMENYKYYPFNKDLALSIGKKFALRGEYNKAFEFYIKGFKPAKLESSIELLMSYFYKTRNYKAVIDLGKPYKNSPNLLVFTGKAYKMQGDFKNAEYCFKKALTIEFSFNGLFAYLDLLAKQKRFNDILELIKRFSPYLKDNQLIILYKINSYIELGMFEKAETLIPYLKDKNIRLWMKGKLLLFKNQNKKAIKILNKIHFKNLTAPNLFVELHKVLLLKKAYENIGNKQMAIKVLEDFKQKTSAFSNIINLELAKLKGSINE